MGSSCAYVGRVDHVDPAEGPPAQAVGDEENGSHQRLVSREAVPPRLATAVQPPGAAAGSGGAAGGAGSGSGGSGGSSSNNTSIAANPTSPQTEEAVRNFMLEVYENWVKAIMSPFYKVNMEVKSPVFRSRVAAAGRKYL